MTQELSQHRHISFTAHYTGYIWYKMGISHPVFATHKGKFLAQLVHPLESWAEKHVGGSMRTTLKQRHTMIDEHLDQLITIHPNIQILEIASGLSPRGWNFRQKYPKINYRELDLPHMAKIKNHALQQVDQNSPEVLSIDLFTPKFAEVFALFNVNRPLVIVSEGLINYFSQDILAELLKVISAQSQSFTELHYLSDVYPEPVKNKLAHFIWSCSRLLKWLSRSSFSFHFAAPNEAKQFIQHSGFQQANIIQPQLYFSEQAVNTDEHLGDLVWMIHASSKQIKNSA